VNRAHQRRHRRDDRTDGLRAPFDLIVMTRTYPPIPPDPALYRALLSAPLILIEITTLSLLTLSPMVKLARATFISFGRTSASTATPGCARSGERRPWPGCR
jgi:hypothetical protein